MTTVVYDGTPRSYPYEPGGDGGDPRFLSGGVGHKGIGRFETASEVIVDVRFSNSFSLWWL